MLKCKECNKNLERNQKSTCSLKCRHLYVGKLNKGNPSWLKGKTHSEETRKKISLSSLGRKHSDEWKKQMSGIMKKNGNEPPHFTGDQSPRWKGTLVGYTALHDWIRKYKGRPQKCEFCGVCSNEKKIQWANKDNLYRRALEDFISLCVSCHSIYDYKFNNKKTRTYRKLTTLEKKHISETTKLAMQKPEVRAKLQRKK